LDALIDFHLLTKWKTAGDSLFAASKLARPDSRNITLVGAGAVARSMHAAYKALFPAARFVVWSRRATTAQTLAADLADCRAEPDLESAVAGADIVCTATMSTQPVLMGDWLRPGQHVDLIGAFRPDMREADDTALQRASLFVDSFDTTLDHIGELKIPLASGAIARSDIHADFYSVSTGGFKRGSNDEITMCKNGGGAHLDMMTARYILEKWRTARN
jgi:ornithine cyclodeaminase